MKTRELALALILLFLIMPTAYAAKTAVIYKNEACGHCSMYLMNLKTLLEKHGFSYVEKNMINDPDVRAELDDISKGIPAELQGHVVTVIGDLFLEGHVPVGMVEDLINRYPDGNFPKMVVYQDLMVDNPETYKVMGADGVIRECSIQTPVLDCNTPNEPIKQSLPLLILLTGLTAGVHPCTISVLLFFIAFLFTVGKTRKIILEVGIAYIIGIFLAYFLIGLGILKAVILFDQPHFAAKAGAVLVILLGLVNIKDYFWYGKWISLKIPHASKKTIRRLIHKSSIPSAFLLGLLVGVCSFGCTAGIYFSILGLLAVKATYMEGLMYLLLYNLTFVVPLIVILAIASSKHVVERIEKWEEKEKRLIKLIGGLVMIALGLVIWFMVI
jgi:cytochrome c biogenesis protein CcdA/glutaredoxin